VELGCGVGLLSVYLAALGAQVYATDLPMVEPLVSKNIKNNAIVVHDRLNFLAYNWYYCSN
jgi:2-polyprenyl-3-methyl-5-hydroxy-6-metoxy-1,4-benzoquinol methylase